MTTPSHRATVPAPRSANAVNLDSKPRPDATGAKPAKPAAPKKEAD